MKAKIKQTGEIVEVEDLYDDGTALVGDMFYKVSELDFYSVIDWEQRRYEISKEALTSIMSNEEFYSLVLDFSREKGNRDITKSISEAAVCFADSLIKELKNKK